MRADSAVGSDGGSRNNAASRNVSPAMRLLLLATLTLLPVVATADPAPEGTRPPRATMSAADRKKLGAQLAKGRALQAKKQFAQASAAFEACLAIVPDDPVALGELGWTQYLANELDKAEATTRKAIANEGAPAVRGATLYNLGVVQQARGDQPGAIASYTQSLQARPNATVRAALKQLDATAAAAFDAYTPKPLASIDAYCKSLPRSARFYGVELDCTCGTPLGVIKPPAPFADARLIKRQCGEHRAHEDFGKIEYLVAVASATGWFVAPAATTELIGHGTEAVKVVDTRLVTIGKAAALAVSYTVTGEYEVLHTDDKWARNELVVVGLGASGVPSATPPIVFKDKETQWTDAGSDDGTTSVPIHVALDVAWAADGTLTLAGKTTGLDKATASDLVGAHRLAFP